MSPRATPKGPALRASESVFTFFCFHCGFSTSHANWHMVCYHAAVAGFFGASFEG